MLTKKAEPKAKIDQYYNIIEVTVYGQARFYLAPPPPPETPPSTASPAPAPTTPSAPPSTTPSTTPSPTPAGSRIARARQGRNAQAG